MWTTRYATNDDDSIKVHRSPIHVVTLSKETDKEESFSGLLVKSMENDGEPSECASDECRRHQVHTHKQQFHDLGEKLIFHVNRGAGTLTADGEFVPRKNQQRVLLTDRLVLDSIQSVDPAKQKTEEYSLRQVLLHIGKTQDGGHFICVEFERGKWLLFDDDKKRQFLGTSVNDLNEELKKRDLLSAIHLVTYIRGVSPNSRLAGCAPLSRLALAWNVPRDHIGTECLPDAVWNIMKQLGYNVKPVEVRQGIKGDNNNLGFRDMPTAERFLAIQDPPLIVQKLPLTDQQEAVLGLMHGNYLLEIRYWLEGDHTGMSPPVHQIHFCAWLADRGILADDSPGIRPIQVDRDQIKSKDYRKSLFKKLWPAAVQVRILSTHFVGKDDEEQMPHDVVQLRQRKLEKKRKKRQQEKKQKRRRKLATAEAIA